MRKRCLNPNHPKYPRYGGRGITICERWSSFENFLMDMGPRPERLTLERIDNNQGYDPFNCVWETRAANNRNTEINNAARERRLSNPPIEKWERQAVREISRPVKPIYVPQKPVHGSKKMYGKHKCRCEICVSTTRERRVRIRTNQSDIARQKKLDYLKEYRRQKRNR